MHIVTDSGCDVTLTPDQQKELGIHIVPLSVTLGGSTYFDSPELDAAGFYSRLAAGNGMPTTSQPAAGVFADLYRKLAAKSAEILSIHISSGLSGTLNSAQAAAAEVPEARITFFDTKTLSVGSGWQVEAAARALRAGWGLDRVLGLLGRIRAATETLFTLQELKYLIHGGRISHIKGLLASVLDIKPIIGVGKEDGKYVQLGQARTISAALRSLVDTMQKRLKGDGPYRAQAVHALNPVGAAELQGIASGRMACDWLNPWRLSLVLGAHTGATLLGAVFAPKAVFEGIS